jgi:hypothetical protein
MKEHDPIEEIHRVRRKMAKDAGYDIATYVRHIQEFEKRLRQDKRFKFYPATEEVETKKVAESEPKKLASKRRMK